MLKNKKTKKQKDLGPKRLPQDYVKSDAQIEEEKKIALEEVKKKERADLQESRKERRKELAINPSERIRVSSNFAFNKIFYNRPLRNEAVPTIDPVLNPRLSQLRQIDVQKKVKRVYSSE
jgi:hypothetical protein